MKPSVLQSHIAHARAVAEATREAASHCTTQQTALRARLVQAAQAIDELIALLEATQFAAKLNHDVIAARLA